MEVGAIGHLTEPPAASAVEARQDRRRIKELERELHRKDKALAETAAFLGGAKTQPAALDRFDAELDRYRHSQSRARRARRSGTVRIPAFRFDQRTCFPDPTWQCPNHGTQRRRWENHNHHEPRAERPGARAGRGWRAPDILRSERRGTFGTSQRIRSLRRKGGNYVHTHRCLNGRQSS